MLSLSARALAASTLLLAACQSSDADSAPAPANLVPTPTSSAPPSVPSSGTIQLNGAGSTFDNPLFSRAFAAYPQKHPNVQVNYQAVRSGAGIQQLTQNTVDFGASDAPLTDEQMQQIRGDAVHVLVTLGAVSVGYNLAGMGDGMTMTGDVLDGIYQGTISSWRDPRITALNPGLDLPDAPMAVVERADGSGTTDIFTTYLSSVSPDWASTVGTGLAVSWPVGIGGKGSEGVAGQVKQIPGSIGYFELAYASENALPSAAIQSGSDYLPPSIEGATRCAASMADATPADLRLRIAGCQGNGAYPVSGFSWVIIRQHQTNQVKAQTLVDLLWWLIHDGQQYAAPLSYAPLPPQIVTLDEQKVHSILVNGQPVAPAAS